MRGLRRIVVLAPLSVAACLAVPTLPPCACIVPPDARGALNMSLDSTPVAFDGSRQTPVGGGVRDDGTVTVTGFDVSLAGTIDPDQPFAWSAPDAGLWVSLPGDMGLTDWRTDPDTVSLRLREVVTGEIGWRVRGDYRGRICPDDGTAADCAPVNGTFAFEQDGTLPDWLASAAGG